MSWSWSLGATVLVLVLRVAVLLTTLHCTISRLSLSRQSMCNLMHYCQYAIIGHYASSTGCPSESVLSSKWHAWFASRCPDRRLSTWQMVAASCLSVLCPLYGQLTSRLAWYHEHTAAMATELLQPRDLFCGTLYPPVQLRNSDIT